MADTARHVNTMEAHHAPNWSRKQHVDGAHDKPSATSGSHGRKPHNATRPKTKHAPVDNESWSHADARAARLGRTESLSGYLFGSAFSAPERQRPAEENRRLWPEEHDEDAATYFTPFDEGRAGVRPDGPETTSTGPLSYASAKLSVKTRLDHWSWRPGVLGCRVGPRSHASDGFIEEGTARPLKKQCGLGSVRH